MRNASEGRGILKMLQIKYLYKDLAHLGSNSEIQRITSEVFRYLHVILRNRKGLPKSHLAKYLPKAVI